MCQIMCQIPASILTLINSHDHSRCQFFLLYFCRVDVYSYDEDDMVEDPNLAQHLAHFGINITQMEKVDFIVLFVQQVLYLCINPLPE